MIDQNHVLTRDWLPCTEEMIRQGQTDRDIKQIYKKCMTAIHEANLVIIEDTVSNFSTGHQITVALQRKKPTLVLWQGNKHRQFNQMFLHGIESDILEISEYNEQNYKEIIHSFIQKYQGAQDRNRFHLVLNNVERRYLDWAQFNKKESRTTVIRDALRKEMNGDIGYKQYLRGKK